MADAMRHGTWWDRMNDIPLERAMEGRFTRLFDAQVHTPYGDEELRALAAAMTATPDAPPTPEPRELRSLARERDAEENTAVPAAYTYFGQFIDHDLTLDPTSSLRGHLSSAELRMLQNFRTPRFDLDNLYGRGPDDQPYLYDGVRMALGARMSGNDSDPHSVDVPRAPNGRALIGDPRNDENRIIVQLQSTMLRFHNAMVDALPDGTDFATVRQQVRWHYQWVIVNDFLPTVVNAQTLETVFPHLASGRSIVDDRPVPRLPGAEKGLELMPVEFSVAAYRFGHSMIRPIYRLNESTARRQIFSSSQDPAGDLGGMRPIPLDWAIDWQFFLDIGDGPTDVPTANDPILRVPQLAYKIDTSLVNPLGMLPPSIVHAPFSLAERNLLRGRAFALPSGQQVAKYLDEDVIGEDRIRIGKATDVKKEQGVLISEISPKFVGDCPLWTYILSEAWQHSWDAVPKPGKATPIRLGPVGGRIVAGTFAAMLLGDPTSVLTSADFSPLPQFRRADGTFGLAQMINAALGRPEGP